MTYDPYAEVRALLIPGRRLRMGFPPPGRRWIIHIRGIVDEQYVTRVRENGRWRYELWDIFYFNSFYRSGGLKPAGYSNPLNRESASNP